MSRLKKTLPLLCICLLFLAGSLMVNRFFREELSNDVERESKRLETLVLRSYMREYQRITILVQSLQQMSIGNDDELRVSLENLLQAYGDEGTIPHILKRAAYSRGDIISSLTEEDGGSLWKSSPMVPEYARPPRGLEEGQVQIKSLEGEQENYLYYHPPGQKEILIILELNKKGMDAYYVVPALEEALNQYTLEWRVMEKNDLRENQSFRKRRLYPFKPLLILSGLDHGEDINLMIPLPDELNSRPFAPGSADWDERDASEERSFKDFYPLIPDSGPFQFRGNVLIIGSEGAPYYIRLERRAALNWMLSQMILLGVLLIFLILLIQLRRTKEIRRREREFVASMTHELRTPITVIQSAADNLAGGVVSGERVTYYGQMMQDQIRRLSTMIEEILTFSSLEGRGPRDFDPVEMDLKSLLEELEETFSPLAEEKKTPLMIEAEGLPERLSSYPAEIKLILSNLISNALNHNRDVDNKDALIRICIRLGIPGELIIRVEDRGPGIPSGEQKKIFDPFYRTSASREHQTRGSGLGLFIARKKAEQTGGSLKVESPYRDLAGDKTGGCRFTLEIPCTVAGKEEEQD